MDFGKGFEGGLAAVLFKDAFIVMKSKGAVKVNALADKWKNEGREVAFMQENTEEGCCFGKVFLSGKYLKSANDLFGVGWDG